MASEHLKNIDYERGTASAVDLHDSVRREHPLSPGGEGGLGSAPFVLALLVACLGGGHLFSSIVASNNYTPAPRPTLGGEEEAAEDVAWIVEWMDDGEQVYGNCIACHQTSGLGLPGQFPPLKGSAWVDGGTKRLGAILLNGITGPFEVAGQTYNQQMPAWNTLGDDQIAQVITYIRREFGSLPEGDEGVVTTEMIAAARKEFGGHDGPYTQSELQAIPAEADLPGSTVDLETGEPAGGGGEAAAAEAESGGQKSSGGKGASGEKSGSGGGGAKAGGGKESDGGKADSGERSGSGGGGAKAGGKDSGGGKSEASGGKNSSGGKGGSDGKNGG